MKDLESDFAAAESSDAIAVHLAFKQRLLESSEDDMLDYHVRCIQRSRNQEFHQLLCRFFAWHGDAGKAYLIRRIPDESDPVLLATLLQILGRIGGTEAAAFARTYLEHEDALVRERACFVLGWTGNSRDLSRLLNLSLNEPEASVRRWSGTQQMHIYFRFEKTKDQVLRNLLQTLESEENTEVLWEHVSTVQQMMKRRFGITKAIAQDDAAQVGAAAEKTRRSLKKYFG